MSAASDARRAQLVHRAKVDGAARMFVAILGDQGLVGRLAAMEDEDARLAEIGRIVEKVTVFDGAVRRLD